MRRLYLLIMCFTVGCLATFADVTQTVTVGGSVVDKFVTTLTFEDNNVVMTFDDNTTQTADMSQVSIDLVYTPVITGISDIRKKSERESKVYTLDGRYVGTTTDGLKKGVYIVGGSKLIVK